MKWVLLMILWGGCTSHQLSDTRRKVEKRWKILEKAAYERWSQEKILGVLGKPRRKDLNKKREFWIYDSSENGFQEWGISFNPDNKTVSYVLYRPSGSMDEEFTLDKVLARWEKFNCQRKRKKFAKHHMVKTVQYYLCDGQKKIKYNYYEELTSIGVSALEEVRQAKK